MNYFLHDINWVGFYITEGNELVLGPFQGLPACVRIPFGKGVCGTAAAEKTNSTCRRCSSFPGHIACDAASQSEIVVPMIKNGRVIGVLDIDSPIKNRFDEIDEQYLQRLLKRLFSISTYKKEADNMASFNILVQRLGFSRPFRCI
ncbi:MAG: hypothetical protein KatS3mg080_0477 [Anoxybacillus sp.]|nr:MAG: hypothetical protein KatS3mg080_0477 [Anoxybacillus sp.]